MLRIVIRRMSISVMAKFIGDAQATRQAISQGMTYQALLIGPICAGFACVGTWIIPLVFGERWLPSVQVFPLIAIAALISAIFDLHAAALYAAGHNREVSRQNLIYIGLLWLGCCLFLPTFQLWGYGLAGLLTIPSFFIIHRALTKFSGSPNYRKAFWLILAALPSLIGSVLLPLGYGVVLFIISYSFLFLFNASIRRVPLELIKTWKQRTASQCF